MNPNSHKKDIDTLAPLYKPGTVVYSKTDATTRLSVMTYSRGVYYCAVIGDAEKNNLPFLEWQLEGDKNL